MRLVLAAARAEGAELEAGLDVACAAELLAEAAALHAGVAAGSMPAAELADGINAGDALAALAHLQILGVPSARPPARTVALVRALHEANYQAAATGDPGSLLGAACELGALAAGAGPGRAQAYARLGRSAGGATPNAAEVENLVRESGIDPDGSVRSLLREAVTSR
jgi:geranylgeranyl diphosphate synthase type I